MLNSLILTWVINSAGSDSESLNPKQGFCLELTRNGEARVVKKGVLLAENSAPESYLAQSSCM